jgi:hypothetical protein
MDMGEFLAEGFGIPDLLRCYFHFHQNGSPRRGYKKAHA